MNIDFEKIKQQITPYFISIYKEQYQDLIIERMKQIEPIFYTTVESKKYAMYNVETSKRIELTIKFLEHCGFNLEDELKGRIMKSNNAYELKEKKEINNFLEAYFGRSEYRELSYGKVYDLIKEPTTNEIGIKKSVEALEKIGIKVNQENYNEWVLTTEAKEVFEQIEKVKIYIKALDEEYKSFDAQFDDLKSLIQKNQEITMTINEKYMILFLKSIEQYLSSQDKACLDAYLNSSQKRFYTLTSKMNFLKMFGNSLNNIGVIEAFSSNADKKLNDSQTKKFVRNSIISDRIKYYKLIGLYKENMTDEEFLMSMEAQNSIPKQSFVDDILEKKEHFGDLAKQEILISTSNYEEIDSRIKSLSLITQPDDILEIIAKKIICVNPNVGIVNGEMKSFALLFFSLDDALPAYIDTSFIHEVNHAIELSLLEYKDNEALYKTGFEILDNDDDRNYESFSEIINQLIAMEITEAMHQDGVYLFDNPNTSKIKGGTAYEQQRFLVEKFWIEFKDVIMRARINNNLDELYNTVGEHNFKELNRVVNEYVQLPYYTMMDDFINKRDTELTRKRVALTNESIQIYHQMMEYSMKYRNETTSTTKTF